MIEKIFSTFRIEYILIDLHNIFPMKPFEFKISLSVKIYYEKTAKNYRNYYVAEKRTVS